MMSSATVKTDNGSKVLPGDKTGLPWEVWRIILSQLSVEDLCRSACVCKTWNDLVLSLDSTRWRDLYFQCSEWKHPYWPLNLNSEPPSWRMMYKECYFSTMFWLQQTREPDTATCLYVFKRNRTRKTITVGQGKDHETLKSALAVANDYDRIKVYPGIYDEQFEMSSKIPFEIIGCGELGSVILVVCIEQIASTGRISNIVFRAPWFTNFILKVRAGYLQVDNCILEDGMVYVQNPGTCNVKFCTFRHATIILQHVNASIIENCEFSQTDSAAITVEGFPKEDKNWTYGSLAVRTARICCFQQRKNRAKSVSDTVPKSVLSLSTTTCTTNQKPNTKSCDHDDKSHDVRSMGLDSCDVSVHSRSRRPSSPGSVPDNFSMMATNSEHSRQGKDIPYLGMSCDTQTSVLLDNGTVNGVGSSVCTSVGGHQIEADDKGQGSKSLDCSEPNSSAHVIGSGAEVKGEQTTECFALNSISSSVGAHGDGNDLKNIPPSKDLAQNVDIDNSDGLKHENTGNCLRQNSTAEGGGSDVVNLPLPNPRLSNAESLHLDLDGLDASDESQDESSSSEGSYQSASGSDVFEEEEDEFATSSSDEDSLGMSVSEDDISSSEESVIMLTYPERHQPRSISATKEQADVASICSQNQSEHIDIIHDYSLQKMVNEVRGCLIYRCRVTQSKGGVMVSLQGQATVMECEINSVGYGVRCIQNSKVVILKNEIHHCRTSGVFMRLAATGLITGNDIHSNCEAGIDIRKNADPIVQSNRIHHGKRSGVVVLGSGRGQIKHNEIYQNREAGVYILYRGNPLVSNNQIYSGRAAGIAVNEGGRGYFQDNVITGNQWGGVDIRHDGDPVISKNVIINGLSDGIVIGEGGIGSIENNIITGNAGCGVWIMAAHQPLLHGNEIHNNRDTGISLVNKMDSSHNNGAMGIDRVDQRDVQSQHSMDFWKIVTEDNQARRKVISMTTLEYNKIYHNNGKGISLEFGEPVLVQCNSVHANKSDGIHVDQTGSVSILTNSVTSNAGSGITVTQSGKVEIRENGIYDNRDYGISCQSDAVIQENDIIGNQRNGILLQNNKSVYVCDNRVHGTTDHCILLRDVKEGSVEANTFYSASSENVRCEKGSNCSVTKNKVMTAPQTKHVDEQQDMASKNLVFTTRWVLTDPPPRPHIKRPAELPSAPAHYVTSVTKVTVPSADTCEQGSKFCTVL